MVSNIILGTNNLKRAEQFYDTLLALFGAEQVMKNERSVLWKSADSETGIAVCTPFDGKSASHGNGCMVGLKAKSLNQLHEVYATALKLGGRSEGEPGERKPGVNAAYFRDPDGNKFGIFYLG